MGSGLEGMVVVPRRRIPGSVCKLLLCRMFEWWTIASLRLLGDCFFVRSLV